MKAVTGSRYKGEMRSCRWCETDISSTHPHRRYCSRSCKDAFANRKRHPIPQGRVCGFCRDSMEGKRAHAEYCSRACKTKASDARRVQDGRGRVRDRARYEREAEHRRAEAKRYLRERPGKAAELRLRRKARLRQVATFRFTETDWQRLIRRFDGCCAYCGQRSEVLHREHVIPLVRGGNHGAGNILPACPSCNASKGTKLLAEWKRDRATYVQAA